MRTISVSEAGALFDCEQRHAFAYTGQITGGDTLRPKETKLILREGRAWGAAVAMWHATGDLVAAHAALLVSVDEDAEQLREHGYFDQAEHDETIRRLRVLLSHYTETAEPISLFDAEREFRVPIPSRTGRRNSNRYVFVGHVDGLTERDGRVWIVEFKLRKRLSSFEQVAWSRQIRWYAWAVEQELGRPVGGVIVDERLNQEPKPPRILQSEKPSHAKDQLTTHIDYAAACDMAGEPVNYETFDALAARRWQERHHVLLTPAEIAQAGQQLVSSAQLVAELDSGRRTPVPNPSQHRCPGCPYRDICVRPHDVALIDSLYERHVPKRSRPQEETLHAVPSHDHQAATEQSQLCESAAA